jgi:hypothetical protein
MARESARIAVLMSSHEPRTNCTQTILGWNFGQQINFQPICFSF